LALKEYISGGFDRIIWTDWNHVVKWECKKDCKAASDNIEANVSQALSVLEVLKQSQ
jgi:hypothetical protein